METSDHDFIALAARLAAHWRRRVVHIRTFPLKPWIEITLGCGHTVRSQVACHPLTAFEELYGLELGDELDCPFCPED